MQPRKQIRIRDGAEKMPARGVCHHYDKQCPPLAGSWEGPGLFRRIAASVGIEAAQSHVEAHSWLGGREDLADTASSEAQKKAKGLNGDERLLGSI